MRTSSKIVPGASLREVLGAIALEGAFQAVLAQGADWTRQHFFEMGQLIVRQHPEYLSAEG
jgi:hypothetical protein